MSFCNCSLPKAPKSLHYILPSLTIQKYFVLFNFNPQFEAQIYSKENVFQSFT